MCRLSCQEGQGLKQRAALFRADPLQEALLHDPDAGLCGGVAGRAGRGDPDEVGDGTRTRIALRASPDHGTVDVLVIQAPPRGAYLRVLGNGGGSELVLTLLVPDPGEAAAMTRQQQVLDGELRAVRDLAEGRTPAGRAAVGAIVGEV